MRLFGRRRGPARPWCDCHLCRPEDGLDARDRKAVADVRQHLVHVVLVSDSACEVEHDHDHPPSDEPDVAYTVGLWHHAQHPDLLISGLPRLEVLHGVVDSLAHRVVDDGLVLEPGRTYEDVLVGVAVTVEELTEQARAAWTTWSTWFHRRDVPVLQVVWPDGEGLFPWQEGAADLDAQQPPSWRVPGPRAGLLAPDPAWPFPVPREHLAFACTHVASGERAVLYVQRDADPDRGEDWSVGCGQAHDLDELELWHLRHALTRCPGLAEVADLPLGHCAERRDATSPWSIAPTPPDEDD